MSKIALITGGAGFIGSHVVIGLKDYGIVAEIWQHTDSLPSDEDDIVRVQDDFKRD